MESPSAAASPPERRALLLGGTGAVGGEVLKALCRSGEWLSVTTLGRRPLDFSAPPWKGLATNKVRQEIVDVLDPASYESLLAGHTHAHTHAFCAFGIGRPTQVPRAEYLKVDIEAPRRFAEACSRQGVGHFTLMTAVGSNPRSSIFYVRTKGELEAAVAALPFRRVSLFRPSTLVTPQNRYGLGQGILLTLTPLIDACLHGSWKRFRGIRIEDLGLAMVRNAEADPGAVSDAKLLERLERLEWPDFMRLLGKSGLAQA